MPCGQKNSTSEISHSQIVTPPFAAMLGTTLRLNTATTNSATKSQRPSERLRCTVSMVDATGSGKETPHGFRNLSRKRPGTLDAEARTVLATDSVAGADGDVRLFLRFRQSRGDFSERRYVPVDVRFGVRYGNGPLLIPPIGLGHYAAIHHGKPIMTPQFAVYVEPVAVIADGLLEEHQRSVGASPDDVSVQTGLRDFLVVAFEQLLV